MEITIGIIAITCIVSYLAFNNINTLEKMLFVPYKMNNNKQEWYRFFSSGLIHGDWNHLIFNMLTLFFFGFPLEGILGPTMFVILYVTALAASCLPSFFKHKTDYNYRALGASGAISAVLFAYIIFQPWSTIYIKFIIPVPAILYALFYVGYSIYMDKKQTDNVGHNVHLWGALYGAAFVLITRPVAAANFTRQLLSKFF